MPTFAQIDPPPDCPLGPITAGVTERGVCLLSFRPITAADGQMDDCSNRLGEPSVIGDHPLLDRLDADLASYFAGTLTEFTVPLDTPGTVWETRVWDALLKIPNGETASYGQIARRLGNPGGSRAVGLANGRNRVAILIPCHRVVASDGSLHGYGGGLDRKSWLLDLEHSQGPGTERYAGGLFASRDAAAR